MKKMLESLYLKHSDSRNLYIFYIPFLKCGDTTFVAHYNLKLYEYHIYAKCQKISQEVIQTPT